MSLLENLTPTKEPISFELGAYKEDIEIFLGALEYLNTHNKSSGKFTQESLFEHLVAQLRSEEEIMSHIRGKQKKKKRGTKNKALAEVEMQQVQ